MTTPAAGWLNDDQQRIWRNWLLATQHVEDYMERVLRDFGLNLSEYELLVRLSEAPNRTLRMGELASMVKHSRSRLTHTIKRMEASGLVERVSCDSDGRGVQAVLTATGMSLLERAAPAHVDSVRRVFVDAIDPADFAALGRAMEASLAVAD